MKWLQWILDNLWTVVIVGGVLAQLLQAIAKKKGGADASPADEEPAEKGFADPELAERTRKIREEIQRKIEQRTRGYAAPPEPEIPPPIIREVTVKSPPPLPSAGASRWDAQRQAEILEEQAALMERLAEAKLMQAAGQKRTEFEAATADHSAARRTATRAAVLGDLHNPEAMRRAFILREVIGPPVALR